MKDLATPRISRTEAAAGADSRQLLSVEGAYSLPMAEAGRLYRRHVNPGLFAIYKILGLADLDITSAEGLEIRLSDGRVVLDFTSSIGVLSLGHNHPRILAAERFCHEHKVIDSIKVMPSKLQAALAYNLSVLLPKPLSVSFFTVSGAEAVEAALKVVEKAQGPARRKFIACSGAYHGKTHGTLAISRTENFGEGFLKGLPDDSVIEIPYGDLEALRQALHRQGSEVAGFIVEPLQGQNVALPPPGYLAKAVAECRRHGVLTIFDEVKVGMGRTGYFCAFMREDVVPDVVTLSKCLGGGKRAIGAMVTSPEIFRRAYGAKKDAGTHTTTFGGLGESCMVAIEALNIIGRPEFLTGVREKGEYLRQGLEALRAKYPSHITGLRGSGLFQGIEFNFASLASRRAREARIPFVRNFEVLLIGSVVRELYRRHSILTHFSASDPSILHVMPPLIVEKDQIDRFISALDQMLASGFLKLGARFLGGNLKEFFKQ